jgi:SAM-dependent methyltransferase
MSVKNCDIPSISPWIRRFSHLFPEAGWVLDLAAGGGRHSRWLLEQGHCVVALDRRIDDLLAIRSERPANDRHRIEVVQADLEDGSLWPFKGRRFAAVIVVNYLYRPLFPLLLESLSSNGLLLYDTFAVGQETIGKPTNPDFLLRQGELLDQVGDHLQVIAFEQGRIRGSDGDAIKQRLAAIKGTALQRLDQP